MLKYVENVEQEMLCLQKNVEGVEVKNYDQREEN